MLNYEVNNDLKQIHNENLKYFVIFKFIDNKYQTVVKDFLSNTNDIEVYSENVYVSCNLLELIIAITNLYRKHPELKYSLLSVEILKAVNVLDAMSIFERQNLN